MAVTQDSDYARLFPASRSLQDRALSVLPGGLAHDSRHLSPFPLYVERAQGSRKWTSDGRELIDFGMGHGALLLGHGNEAIRDAVVAQLARGIHFSACHPLEVDWAERVCRLVPCAELVRFTGTGTEATMLAMRLSRAFTGRPRILKLRGHFHGWHDEAAVGNGPDGRPATAGYNPATVTLTTAAPTNDLAAVRRELETGEYAGMILEPSGASWATVPLPEGYLQGVRDLTERTGTLLIFDEVVSGFRFAPGGAQERYGVTPDLCALAKALAGGLPGGAVAGRRDVMDRLAFHDDARDEEKVAQQGTFNANPLSAAAGIAALDQLADGSAQKQATATTKRLCGAVNAALLALDAPGCAYHVESMFHLYVGEDCPIWVEGDEIRGELDLVRLKRGMPGLAEFRRGLNEHGVDLMRDGGLVSTAHTDEDIDRLVEAVEAAVRSRRS